MNTAFCIVTRNHGDVLLNTSPLYFASMLKHGFDIYIYDSSDDDMTKNLVLAWNARGYENVYWLDCRFTESGDEKVLLIYNQAGFQKHYDYVWLCKDRMVYSENYLTRLCQAMESKPDAILAADEEESYHYSIPRFADSYTNPVDFFRDFGATTTNWCSLLLRTETMLQDVDFDFYDKTYNINKSNPFQQTVFLFSRLADLTNCSIQIVRSMPNDVATYKEAGSGWLPQIVNLWGVMWPNAIRKLPTLYDSQKDHVIKTECMHSNLFASVAQLVGLEQAGYLTKENFELLREDWHKLSDIPISWVDLVLEKNLNKVCSLVVDALSSAFATENYETALWLFLSNPWLNQVFPEKDYPKVKKYMEAYQKETIGGKSSSLLRGVHSLQDLIRKASNYKKQ